MIPALTALADGVHYLEPAAAASYHRMCAAYGAPLPLTSAYRPTEEQAQLRAAYLEGRGSFALPPGVSKHEKGLAGDFGRACWDWIDAHAIAHGWVQTNPKERWHREYQVTRDEHRHDPTPHPPRTEKMLKLAKIASDPRIYVGDGVVRRHVPDPTTLADLQYRMQTGELPGDPVVHVVSRIEWLGEDVTR